MNALPLVSVIIPTKNSSHTLPALLQSCQNQTYSFIEIIVIDNNSTDETIDIAHEYNIQLLSKGPERSAQRNFGAKHANGDYFLFIDSDMILTPHVIQSAVESMIANPEWHALIIPEESFGQNFWAKCKKLERSFYVGIPWMEAARFFRRNTFKEFDGYDENNTGTEDYDLPQRIEQAYGTHSIGRISELIYHDEGNLSLLNSCKKKFYYSRKITQYKNKSANQDKFAKQSSPIQRYRLFLSHPVRLFANPIFGFGMLFMKTAEFAFGFAGYAVNLSRLNSPKDYI